MAGRNNRHGWTVLVSVGSTDGSYCVDFFENSDGTFGFEHFRADVEDGGAWQIIGGFSSTRFESAIDAAEAAPNHISWLMTEPQPKAASETWRAELSSGRQPGRAD